MLARDIADSRHRRST